MAIALTSHDIHVIRILASISGGLSCFGASMLFLSFFLFTELRTYSSRLILYLSISDMGEAIAWAMAPSSDKHGACIAEAWGIQFFGVSSVLWQICIATYILQVCLGRKNIGKQEKYYHLICWGIPLSTIIGGAVKDIYGNSGAWCWVQHPHELLGLFLLYFPFMLSIPYCIFTTIYVDYLLKRKERLSEADKISVQKIRTKLRSRYYLVPYALCWMFGLLNRANNAASDNRIAALYILQAIFFPLQGFWNFVMYGYTERIVGPQDIHQVLENSTHIKFFSAFLESIRANENLNCWLAINELKTMSEHDPNLAIAAKKIHDEYIKVDAVQCVNISSVQRESLDTLSVAAFIAVQSELVNLMNTNIVSFRASKYYKELVAELQSVEAIGGNSAGKSLLFTLYSKLRVLTTRSRRDFGTITESSDSIT